MIFNNPFLKYDQYGFQQVLFVGVFIINNKDTWSHSYSRVFRTNVYNISIRKHFKERNYRRFRWLFSRFTCYQKGNSNSLQLLNKGITALRPRWHFDRVTHRTKNHRKRVYDSDWKKTFLYQQTFSRSSIKHRMVPWSQLLHGRTYHLGQEQRLCHAKCWWLQ